MKRFNGKIQVGTGLGHGESWDEIGIDRGSFPEEMFEPNTARRFLTPEAKRNIKLGKIKVIILVQE